VDRVHRDFASQRQARRGRRLGTDWLVCAIAAPAPESRGGILRRRRGPSAPPPGNALRRSEATDRDQLGPPFIPRPLPRSDKGHLLPDLYSGATTTGRFSEEFLLRR